MLQRCRRLGNDCRDDIRHRHRLPDLEHPRAWETPLVGSDGSVTFGTGNPYQTPAAAIAHPSKQLYTDSDVDLDAATGKLRWYYQGVPDDFLDHDMQASLVSTSVKGVPVVIGSGKMGYVYEMNAENGKLIWKTPVGEHNAPWATTRC